MRYRPSADFLAALGFLLCLVLALFFSTGCAHRPCARNDEECQLAQRVLAEPQQRAAAEAERQQSVDEALRRK